MAERPDRIKRYAGPRTHISWTPDYTPESDRIEMVLVASDDLEALERQHAASQERAGEMFERQAKAVRHHIARSDGLARELGAARAVVEAAIRWRNRLGYYPCDEACSHALCGLVRALGVEPMGIPEHLQAPGEPTKLSAVAVLAAAIAAEGETA